MIIKNNRQRRDKIKFTIRKKIYGTSDKPRFSVYRSLNHIYGQIIDDTKSLTLVSCSSKSKELQNELATTKSKIEKSAIVGKALAKLAIEKNISTVVFDRNGCLFHGRIKAIADGAREAGLKF